MDLKSLEISPWISWVRKIKTLATVTRCGLGSSLSTRDFFSGVGILHDKAAKEASPNRKIQMLWRIEGLAYRYFENNHSPENLQDRIPTEAGPPSHCGLGMAAVLNCGFDPAEISSYIESTADSRFIRAAYESVGVMLAASEPDFFGRLTTLLGRLRIIRQAPLDRPEPGEFMEGFQGDIPEFISHGFGRLLYFKKHRLSSAITQAKQTSYLSTNACIHGSVGAYTLVNSQALEKVLRLTEVDDEPAIVESISAGLYNTLLLFEWTSPGCLSELEGATETAKEIIQRASEFAHWARTENMGPLFVA